MKKEEKGEVHKGWDMRNHDVKFTTAILFTFGNIANFHKLAVIHNL